MKTKLFIVDDHPFTRAGVRSLLETNSAIDIIGEAEDGIDAVKQVIDKQPNIVVMDINMPQLSGIDATREIQNKFPDIKIIALSIHKGEIFVKRMLDAGAVGYLLKDEAPDELLSAIQKVNKGDIYLSSGVTRAALSKARHSEELTRMSVLQSKLQRPPITFDYVVRTKIIYELENNIVKPLSIVSAGAGYGKSVVVSQWLEQTEFLYSWISLDEEHNDFRTFLHYLIASIEKVFPGLLENTQDLVFAPNLPSGTDISNALINELCNIDQDFILVLDDYHLIKERKIHDLLDEWLRFPPPSVHLCIITRRDPPLKIKSFHISGRMTEIRMDKLSFTIEEIVELFKQVKNVDLHDKSAKLLHDKTEGWIIGLRLVSMILKSQEELDQTLQSSKGGLLPLTDYLLTEVLSIQTEHIQDQLFATSILERFCADLIEAIIEPKGENNLKGTSGTEFIQWLIKSNLFVVPLDLEQKWFRYHNMFKDFLQNELKKRRNSQLKIEIHIKASQWFEKHDFLEEAMHHALNIVEYNRAAEIVKTHRMHLLNTGQWQLLKRLYRRLPKMIVERDPELLLLDAYLSFYQSDHTRVGEVVNMIGSFMSGLDKNSILYGEYNFFLGYTTMYLKGDPATCLDYMKIALKEIPESAAESRALVELYYPMFSQISGQYSKAIKWFEETISKSKDFAEIRKNRLFLSIFWTSTAEADLNRVENYYLQGLKLAHESKIVDSLGTCLMMCGELFMRRGDWESAIQYFEEVVDHRHTVHTRSVIDCMTSLVVIFSMLGKHLRSLELIKELESYTQELSDYLKRFLWSCKVRYHLLINDIQIVRDLLRQYSPNFVHLVFWIDIPEITYSRALIFEGSEENLRLAKEELNKLELMVTSQNNWVHLLEVYALQAILYDKQGELEKAREKLIKSIELAEPGRIVAYYAELGEPIERLISTMPDEFKKRPLIKEVLKVMKMIPLNLVVRSPEKVVKSSGQKEKLNVLTQREIEVLQCISKGLRNQEIADKLFNSEETIKKHIYHMFQKMEVKNRLSLVSKAKEEGILT